MTYKNKHLRKFLPYAAATIISLTLFSCGNNKSDDNNKYTTSQGLLDKQKIEANDKYGNKVILEQVDIPLYDINNRRRKDCYILTRGQDTELFAEHNYGKLTLQQAHLNGSNEAVYIRVGEHNEIVDESGKFVGLVLNEKGQAEAIAPQNILKYIEEFNTKIIATNTIYKNLPKAKLKDVGIFSDELFLDTLQTIKTDSMAIDSVASPQKIDAAIIDSISHNNQQY